MIALTHSPALPERQALPVVIQCTTMYYNVTQKEPIIMASVRLPEGLDRWLTDIAALTKRSKSYCIKEALERYCEDMEDLAAVTKAMNNPNRKFYTTEELLANLKERRKKREH